MPDSLPLSLPLYPHLSQFLSLPPSPPHISPLLPTLSSTPPSCLSPPPLPLPPTYIRSAPPDNSHPSAHMLLLPSLPQAPLSPSLSIAPCISLLSSPSLPLSSSDTSQAYSLSCSAPRSLSPHPHTSPLSLLAFSLPAPRTTSPLSLLPPTLFSSRSIPLLSVSSPPRSSVQFPLPPDPHPLLHSSLSPENASPSAWPSLLQTVPSGSPSGIPSLLPLLPPSASDRTSPPLPLSSSRSVLLPSAQASLPAHSALSASHQTADCGSGPFLLPSPLPPSQTAHPDAHMLPALLLLPLSPSPESFSHPSLPLPSPACSRKTLSALPALLSLDSL